LNASATFFRWGLQEWRDYSDRERNIMTIKLPRIINDYVNASNAHDVKCILVCFSDDAVVRDEGKEFRGKEMIEGWLVKTIEKYQAGQR
jgi:ketosteroid isomerase-like protein